MPRLQKLSVVHCDACALEFNEKVKTNSTLNMIMTTKSLTNSNIMDTPPLQLKQHRALLDCHLPTLASFKWLLQKGAMLPTK